MSRFGKESGPRRKSELGASKRTRLSLIAVLAGLTMMIVGFNTISAGAASAATAPTVVPVPPIPDGITYTDPCGPNNANWNQPPDSVQTAQFVYSVNRQVQPYHLIVTDFNNNEQFPTGDQVPNEPNQHDYGTAPDSGVACPPPPPTQVSVPAQPSVTDPCNPAGVSDNVAWNRPADTTTFAWTVLNNGDLRVTIKPANTTFPGGATSHDYAKPADSGVACVTHTPPPAKDVCSNIPGNQSVVPSGYVKAGTRCVKQHVDQPLPVTGSKHHTKPTVLPDTGWPAGAPQSKQNSDLSVALLFVAGGFLLFGTGGTRLCVAAARRRKGGES